MIPFSIQIRLTFTSNDYDRFNQITTMVTVDASEFTDPSRCAREKIRTNARTSHAFNGIDGRFPCSPSEIRNRPSRVRFLRFR